MDRNKGRGTLFYKRTARCRKWHWVMAGCDLESAKKGAYGKGVWRHEAWEGEFNLTPSANDVYVTSDQIVEWTVA